MPLLTTNASQSPATFPLKPAASGPTLLIANEHPETVCHPPAFSYVVFSRSMLAASGRGSLLPAPSCVAAREAIGSEGRSKAPRSDNFKRIRPIPQIRHRRREPPASVRWKKSLIYRHEENASSKCGSLHTTPEMGHTSNKATAGSQKCTKNLSSSKSMNIINPYTIQSPQPSSLCVLHLFSNRPHQPYRPLPDLDFGPLPASSGSIAAKADGFRGQGQVVNALLVQRCDGSQQVFGTSADLQKREGKGREGEEGRRGGLFERG